MAVVQHSEFFRVHARPPRAFPGSYRFYVTGLRLPPCFTSLIIMNNTRPAFLFPSRTGCVEECKYFRCCYNSDRSRTEAPRAALCPAGPAALMWGPARSWDRHTGLPGAMLLSRKVGPEVPSAQHHLSPPRELRPGVFSTVRSCFTRGTCSKQWR